jgi:CheY-like chemotaxis protein
MNTGRYKVLVVDDDDSLIELVRETLSSIKSAKILITATDNGQSGYVKAKELKPDLILLDVYMPRWDGFQVYAMLKDHDETRNIPVVFLTASHDKSDIEKALKMGVRHYLAKPFDPEALLKKVKEILDIKGD